MRPLERFAQTARGGARLVSSFRFSFFEGDPNFSRRALSNPPVSRVTSLAAILEPPPLGPPPVLARPPESGPALSRPALQRVGVAGPSRALPPLPGSTAPTRMPAVTDRTDPVSRTEGTDPSRRTDRELVDRARGGDARAFSELVRRHQRRLHRLALHILRDRAEAEDVTQETFVRAYNALARFDGRSEPYTWLYRITVNLSLNAIRARKSAKRVSGAPADDPRLDGLSEARSQGQGQSVDPVDAGKRQLYAALSVAIDDLSETLRTTLILVCIDGRSHEEAAEILGAPEGTIAWRVHEARRKLRETLAERGFDLTEALRECGGAQ
jgi:RNA polymerase sigma-70 factor (ECF subfamily)